MKIQNNNISDFEQKNVKVHRNVASKKMKVGVMWSALFVLAVIGVLSVIGAVLSIKPKTEAENKNLVTYASMPLEIQDGVITKYNGTTDGTAVLNIPATYDVVDGKFVEGNTYKITGIGENVFKDVNFALLIVNLDNITRIGDSAFENATRVAFVGGNGYTIGKNAFKNASVALEEVKVLPNGEEPAVDVDAFSGTTFLKSLKLHNSLSAEEVSSATAFTTTAVRGIIKFASNSLTSASSVSLSGFSGKVIFADNSANGATSLGAVTLNSKLSVEIGANAFKDTTNSNFAISGNANFRQIGSNAFSGSKIQSLNLSTSSLKTISQGMFYQCGSLTSVTIPSSVTSIGESAFESCEAFTSITIPNNVTSIGVGAFKLCTSLASITLPSSVTTIGDAAFEGCDGLNSITIESTAIPTLGSNAFISTNNCDINVSSAQFVMSAFSNASWSNYLNRLVYPNLVVQYNDGGTTKVGEIEVGTTIDQSTLNSTMVGGGTIPSPQNQNVLKVYIPKGVTTIGNYAFQYCIGLTSITIPSSVTTIREFAFVQCEGLTSITIPDSVTSIGGMSFQYCSSLTSITIGSGVTSIGMSAFDGCSGLTSITIEATTPPTLYSGAFSSTNNCPIYVPDASVNAYKSAWSSYADRIYAIPDTSWSNYLNRLVDPTNLVVQYNDGGSTKIGEIVVGTAIDLSTLNSTMVGGGTISSPQSNVLKVYIPNGVTTIEDYAFQNYSGLTSINIPDGVTTIGMYAFEGCRGLTSITIPDSVESIESWSFQYCSSLTSITIPDSVTTIGRSAFSGCSNLTSITIGSGVTEIGFRAFMNCSGLTSITIEATTPPTLDSESEQFRNTNNCPIYVPSAKVSTYKSAWSDYASRIYAIS